MLINEEIYYELNSDAGTTRAEKARKYKNAKRVEIINFEYEDKNNFEISGIVVGSENYKTYLQVVNGEIENITCDCPDYYNHYGVCKHSLATLIEVMEENYENKEKDEKQEKIEQKIDFIGIDKNKDYRNFKQIVNTFYNEEIEEMEQEEESIIKNKGTIKLEPKVSYEKFSGDMKVEFKIGNKRMYKIKNLSEFYTRMTEKEYFKYGEKLGFVHVKEVFEESSKKILEFLLRYAEIIKYANSNSNSNYRYYGKALSETSIILGNSGIDDFFEVLKGELINFQKDYKNQEIKFVEENPEIKFTLKKANETEYTLSPSIEIYDVTIIKGKKYKYILREDKLYRCTKEFENTTLKLLELFRKNYMTEVKFGKSELSQLFSIIIPKAKDAIEMEGIDKKDIEKYKPKELEIKVFLDFDKNDYLVANVKFVYESEEFNPLDENISPEFARNMIQETKGLNIFRKTGFMLDVKNLRFILPDNDKIYEFLTEDINYYMQKFDILATEKFKTKQIKQTKIGGLGVKVENNLLSIDLKELDIDVNELEEIMSKYTLKKKYHRLKDGSFINLQDNKEIEFLDKLVTGMDLEYKELENGEVTLPVHRSLYLNQLLKEIKGTKVVKNSEYKEIVNELNKDQLEEDIIVPENLDKILRYYQKTGFKWLKILDQYKFGGILADDMGLGKTVQMLSVVVDYIQNTEIEEKRASLVISPSSLTLNWQNESKKFAQDLKTLVIRGSLSERKSQIKEIDKYDLVITSYDLLKRDIELYKEKDYEFRYIIADEAQYLKNSNTQNAKSIKKIKATTRYALTGTPIENSLAELWSIFDFIMPGYLFGYKKFKNLYEMPIIKEQDETAMDKLRMLIEPFVLRRIKKEVLKELPDKTITILNNEMQEEQKNIYMSYLTKAKQELKEKIDYDGFEKSQMQILAILTRLRQICCHPSLFIDDYKDGSSKLEQCLEIVQEATNGGHKILLFSSYTSMFGLMEKELNKRNIKFFKLTGKTKVDERIGLVDEFNENPEIKVFLISLKAGGTGLNLTGADMVIHYDPWWNLSTENQATDRAYRIGQKKNVQVYKMITKNSIEEKIYELQQKKSELADNMLSTKTSFINKLSKEDIMNLFE